MHLVVEVRQIVFVRPFLDLSRLAIGASISIFTVAIPLVQPSLVLPLELVVENDSIDARAAIG